MSDPIRVRRRGRTGPESSVAVELATVTDSRINGNAFRLLTMLRMLSDMEHPPTQTEVAAELGLGGTAFRQAKLQLRAAGYLVEVRDRYPRGHRVQQWNEASGEYVWRSRGGQNRYSYWLQDPLPKGSVSEDESLIISDVPIDLSEETPGQNRSTKRKPVSETGLRNVERSQKPQVRTGLRNVKRFETGLRNVNPLKEEQVGRLVGFKDSIRPTDLPDRDARANPTPDPVPTEPHPPHDVAAVDAELAALDPNLTLTYAQITREINGRVDLAQVDVVQAVRDTVIRAARRGAVIESPAAYAAGVIVRKPEAWPRGAVRPAPFRLDPDAALSRPDPRAIAQAEREACARGEHDWGPEVWGEIARASCVRPACLVSRRSVDQAFADLEDHYDLSRGGI